MANSEGPSSIRNVLCGGKSSLLPPKSPLPSISPSYVEYIPNIIQKGTPKPRDGNQNHQRTSSESFLIDEQPSWLDDLLNEPDSPVHKGGHRRSSSDSFTSFAYFGGANVVANSGYIVQDLNKFRNMLPLPSWGSQLDYHGDAWNNACFADPNVLSKHMNRARDSSPNKITHPSGIPSPRENSVLQNSDSSYPQQEGERAQSPATVKQDVVELDPADTNSSAEKELCHAKISATETDTKRAKQQFAQRSRVRKLQYIADLERTVQVLQAKGIEAAAELDFLNQQNLIMSMENKALKQRLESLAQEQLIKYLEHEVLERERGRLRALYQQQQLQQRARPQPQKPPNSGHRLTKSVDLDKQFANLSLKY